MCVCFYCMYVFFRKEKDLFEEKIRNSNLEREKELIEHIIKESGGKLTKRSVNTQVKWTQKYEEELLRKALA